MSLSSIPELYLGIFMIVYSAIWLVGFVFQFRVTRKLKVIARSGEKEPGIAQEMLKPKSVDRDLKFIKFLYSSEVSRLSDPILRRDCQIMRIAAVGVAGFLVLGSLIFFVR